MAAEPGRRTHPDKENTMRMTHFGAIAASAALASATVLGPGTALAQDNGDPAHIVSAGNYEMSATNLGDCQVEFELTSLRDKNYGNWRGDFQVNGEEPITEVGGSRDEVYRPVVTNRQGVADAIGNRANPYDLRMSATTVHLGDEHRVPDFSSDGQSETITLPGVEPNETGEYTINFGVYQGPVTAGNTAVYNTNGQITVTGCPVIDPLDELSSELGISGSLDLFS